jgi:fatty acid desaturase
VLQAHRAIDGWQQAGCAYVAGLMLSTNHIVGHELVHRRSSRLAMLAGRWLLAGNGDAQFSVSHVYGHHMNVGTPADPATARRGENVYAFALRSARGQYVEALELEHRRLQRLGHGFWNPRNAVFTGLLMSLVLVVVAAVLGGVAGVAMLLGSMLTAKFLFEIVNYIQHYGIVRVPGARVDPRHSWDSDHLWATYTFYCLSRHSHHHAKPVLPYWALQSCGPDESGPGIRHGYIASMLIACVPPWWRRYMAPALAHWDAVLATPEELQLITHPTRRADRHAQPKGATP